MHSTVIMRLASLLPIVGMAAGCGGDAGPRAKHAVASLSHAAAVGDADAVRATVESMVGRAGEDPEFRRLVTALLQARVPRESNEEAVKMGLEAAPSVLALCAIRGELGVAALARGLAPYFRSMAGARVGPSANSPDHALDFSTLTTEEVRALIAILRSSKEDEGARIGAALMLPWSAAAIRDPELLRLFDSILASEEVSLDLKDAVQQAKRLLVLTEERLDGASASAGD